MPCQAGRSTGPDGTPGRKTPVGKIVGAVIAVLVLALLVFNSTYEIKEQEQAVLITLGRVYICLLW